MSATTLTLTIEPGPLDARSTWTEFESLAVQMSREVPLRALEDTLSDAQDRLIDSVCGPRWAPARGWAAPFACLRCGTREDFARKGQALSVRSVDQDNVQALLHQVERTPSGGTTGPKSLIHVLTADPMTRDESRLAHVIDAVLVA